MSLANSIQSDSPSGLGRSMAAHQSVLTSTTVRVLEAVGEFCLLAVIFIVPLMMAVIRESGVALFVSCSFMMSVSWALRQLILPDSNSRFTPAFLIPLCGVALVAAQLMSLPGWLLEFASPFSRDYLKVWNEGHELLANNHSWSRLSMTPSLTRSGLVLLIAYVMFFLALIQKMKSLKDVDRLLTYLAASTVVVAFVGLGQLFFGNGQFLWMFEHPFRDASWPAKATFTNQNHFVHFLALGIGPLAWVWKINSTSDDGVKNSRANIGFGAQRKSGTLKYILGGLIAVVVLAGFLSFSRGGISVLLIAAAISIVAIGKHLRGVAKIAVPLVAFIALGVLVFGTEALENKWNSIAGAGSVTALSTGRFALWSALLDGFPHFWLAGAGVGSHAEVYPVWLQTNFGVRFSHAESGYLQILIETGLLGITLVLSGIGVGFYWVVKALQNAGEDRFRRTRVLILLAGLCVTVLHSAVDFVWFIPACAIFAIIIFACLLRTHQLYAKSVASAVPAWPTNFALLVVLAAIPVCSLSADVIHRDMASEASWAAYRNDAINSARTGGYVSTDELDQRLDRMIDNLEICLRNDPSDFRAMSDLSTLYLRRFEREQQGCDNPMSLREIKNTVETSGFESPEAVADWLQRAYGAHVIDLYRSLLMAENAVTGQPMRGECYLVLAQVGFLKETSFEEANRLIDQAVILRPYSPGVLYFAGLLEAEKGDVDAACQWWKKAFHLSDEIQPVILQGLETHMSPAEIVGYLDPGTDALWFMFQNYSQQGNVEAANWIADYYRTNFKNYVRELNEPTAAFWQHSEQIFTALNELDIATQCLGRAVKLSPNIFNLRKRYALALLDIHKHDDARRELNWCRLKSPGDLQITAALKVLGELTRKGTTRGY